VGRAHVCAVTSLGAAKCWGVNDYGQLGDGTIQGEFGAVPVQGLSSGVLAVAAGDLHSCAVAGGKVVCWGSNSEGQLGDGTTAEEHAPVDVAGLASGVVGIAAGAYHACVLGS